MNKEYYIISEDTAIVLSDSGLLARTVINNFEECLLQENRCEKLEELLLKKTKEKEQLVNLKNVSKMIFILGLVSAPVIGYGIPLILGIPEALFVGTLMFLLTSLFPISAFKEFKEQTKMLAGLEFQILETSKELEVEKGKLMEFFLEEKRNLYKEKFNVRVKLDDKKLLDELENTLDLQYFFGINQDKIVKCLDKNELSFYLDNMSIEQLQKIRLYLKDLSSSDYLVFPDEEKKIVKVKKVQH